MNSERSNISLIPRTDNDLILMYGGKLGLCCINALRSSESDMQFYSSVIITSLLHDAETSIKGQSRYVQFFQGATLEDYETSMKDTANLFNKSSWAMLQQHLERVTKDLNPQLATQKHAELAILQRISQLAQEQLQHYL